MRACHQMLKMHASLLRLSDTSGYLTSNSISEPSLSRLLELNNISITFNKNTIKTIDKRVLHISLLVALPEQVLTEPLSCRYNKMQSSSSLSVLVGKLSHWNQWSCDPSSLQSSLRESRCIVCHVRVVCLCRSACCHVRVMCQCHSACCHVRGVNQRAAMSVAPVAIRIIWLSSSYRWR